MYLDEARKAVADTRWTRKCSLMGCTDPHRAHDHHMQNGHLSVAACRCYSQDGQPGTLGVHEGGSAM